VLPLPAGRTVCLFTDGVTDARLGEGRAGYDELASWLRELGPEVTAERVLGVLDQRAGSIEDDVTVCVLRGVDEAPAAAEPLEELVVGPGEGPALIRFLVACGVGPARSAELAVRLEEAPEGSQMVAQVRIGTRASHADLRPLPAHAPAFAA
jgi:hypothetical protein